jgi:hypothetical protein
MEKVAAYAKLPTTPEGIFAAKAAGHGKISGPPAERIAMAKIEVKRTPEGRILARRTDGRPLTEIDRKEAEQLAVASTGDPILGVDLWFPEFHRLRQRVAAEAPDFDYVQVHKLHPDLYAELKALERRIDELEEARLSQIMDIMTQWRAAILQGQKLCGPGAPAPAETEK